MDQVEKDLRDLWVARDRATWVAGTYINDDTEALAANGEEATSAYVTRKVHEAQRFAGLDLPADLARKFQLLRTAQTIPSPSDPKKGKELAEIETAMTGAYGKATFCPPKGSKLAAVLKKGETCLHLDDLEKVLSESRDPATLTEAWNGWHSTARNQRARYVKYVSIANEGARELGFDDVGALWRAGYDMPPAEFEADVERLWSQVKPLYDELHCYVRAKLRTRYGKDKIPDHGPIPTQYLGNMWAQGWGAISSTSVEPYQGGAVARRLEDAQGEEDRPEGDGRRSA